MTDDQKQGEDFRARDADKAAEGIRPRDTADVEGHIMARDGEGFRARDAEGIRPIDMDEPEEPGRFAR